MDGDCPCATTERGEGVVVEGLGLAGAGAGTDDDGGAGAETGVGGTTGGATVGVATDGVTTGVFKTGVVTTGVVTTGGGTGSDGTVGTPGTPGAALGPSASAAGTSSAANMATARVSNRLTCPQRASDADGCGPARAVNQQGMDWSDGTTASGEGEGAAGWEPRVETCRIGLWRGYRESSFYARPDGDTAGTSIGAPSTSFRRRGSAAPDTPEARLALQELVSRLEANGWVQTGRGGDWYEAEFARTTLVPSRRADEIAEETAEAAPEHEPEHHRPMPAARTIPPASSPPTPPVPERRHLDRWRVAAATGLAAAIGLLGWFAAHPSSLRAASPTFSPQLGVMRVFSWPRDVISIVGR